MGTGIYLNIAKDAFLGAKLTEINIAGTVVPESNAFKDCNANVWLHVVDNKRNVKKM